MRNPEYQFISTDTETVVSQFTAMYEAICGVSVHPASPEKLFILWVASLFIHERMQANYIGNQNLPSRAESKNLDALAADLYNNIKRPAAQPAVCTVRFWISEAQKVPILIPSGTRVTDTKNTLTWETTRDAYIPSGELYIDLPVRCQTAGVAGMGYAPGQIVSIIDLYDYCDHCENITTSDDGTDEATDDEFYELMRASMDGLSSGGARGSYIYNAKKVSTKIADVAVNSPGDARIAIYVLMDDGTIAGDEIKAAVLASCNPDNVRPITDRVEVADPTVVEYDISLTYYINNEATISSAEIQAAARAATQEYVVWQSGRLGRDINPDKLREFIFNVGKSYDKDTGQYVGVSAIKRIVLENPSYTPLLNGKEKGPDFKDLGTVPQVARVRKITLTNGGYEDE